MPSIQPKHKAWSRACGQSIDGFPVPFFPEPDEQLGRTRDPKRAAEAARDAEHPRRVRAGERRDVIGRQAGDGHDHGAAGFA